MPHVVLAGAPTGCWTNLGDEAILAGMVDGLRGAIDDLAITVIASSPAATYQPYWCTAVRYDDPEAVAAAVASADAVLLGGGSIFFDYWGSAINAVLTEKPTGLALWSTLALLAAADDIPVMAYDIGLTPLHTADGTLLTRATLEICRAVTVRDRDSQALAAAWGGPTEKVIHAGDPAIRVDLDHTAAGEVDLLAGLAGPVLGVSLRQWDKGIGNLDRWHGSLAEVCDTWIETRGGTVVFIPCHRAVNWPLTDDIAAAAAVVARMRHGSATRALGANSPWAARAKALTGCDAVLAMRYHAALFALRAGVPTVGLSYDAKVTGLFADWGLADRCLTLRAAAKDPAHISTLLREAGDDPAIHAGASAMGSREAEAARIAATLVSEGRPVERATAEGSSPLTRQLLRRIDSQPTQRPVIYDEALGRLRDRLRRAPGAPKTVAILTNRLVHAKTGKPQIGGAERYALALGELLRDLGLEVTFYQGGGEFEVADYFGFPVYPLPFGEAVGEFQIGIGTAFFERTRDADHVLYLMPNYAAGPIREDALVVSHGVWWDHDEWPHLVLRTEEWYAQLKQVFTAPRRVISVDANTRNVVAALFPEAGEKIRHVPSAVDTDIFRPPERGETDEPLVLFPRRAETVRGSKLVGPIMELVPDPARFIWVGTGSAEQVAALRSIADRDDRLTVTTASFAKMAKHYAAADICVIPTIGSEGQSLSALEAMASGCAVVVTRIGGLPELVTDGVDGLVCDPTAESLAAAIRRLVRDPGLRARLGAAARETALRHDLLSWRANWARELAELGWIESTTAATPYDVIKFSVVDFDYRYQRPQQTAVTWGRRGRRVFYVQRAGHRLPKGQLFEILPVAENVYTVRLSMPAGTNVYQGPPSRDAVRAAMRSLTALREAWDIGAAVSVAEFGTWWPVVAAARRRFGWPVHYDCMDKWPTFPAFTGRAAVMAAEPTLVRGADSMTVTARAIQQFWAADRPDAAMARNAADFAFFHEAPPGEAPPEPLRKIAPSPGTKVAGFIGAVEGWVDQDLIRYLAERRPEVQFVFVGGITRTSVDSLADLANVHFVGLQPYADMPRYVRAFDVCLVPFIPNEATESMDLVKVYEYLASGRPIVSTPVAEMVRYGRYLRLAATPQEFLAQLDAALTEHDPAAVAARVAMARLNSWDARVDVIEAEILPTLSRRAGDRAGGVADAGTSTADLQARLKAALRTLSRYEHSRAAAPARLYWRIRNRLRRGR